MNKALKNRLVAYPLVFGAGYGVLCAFLAYKYVHPDSFVPTTPHWLNDTVVPTDAGDDPAWVTKGFGKGRVLFVMAHGYGGTRSSWSDVMKHLHAAGFDCVAPAMPAQDASPDRSVGFGKKEAKVIADTVTWARKQYAKPPKVILMGVSMGGAASWLATDLVPDVDGVVTEGAYARFDESMNQFFDRMGSGVNTALKPVVWIARGLSKVDPSSIVPLDSATRWKGRPALVIQAENDTLILRSHAERLAKASGAELWIVKNATHASCSEVEPQEYVARLVKFANGLADRSQSQVRLPELVNSR